MLAFDLDPGEPATAVECAQVALRLRELFGELGLECFAKHSGSKGIQVYVPLNTAVTYERTKPYARAVAQALERAEPELVVSKQKKELRKGKVLVDWSQNDYSKTTVAVYSLRCRERPVGLGAADLGRGRRARRRRRPRVGALRGRPRCSSGSSEHGDLFAPVLELKQKLPEEPRACGIGSMAADGRAAPRQRSEPGPTWAAGDFDAIAERIWAVGDDLVDRVGVSEGDRVLDVACGTGNARSRRPPRGGEVTGLDITPELFEDGRRRAARRRGRDRVGRGRRRGPAVRRASFDVVLSTFGCMFAPRPRGRGGRDRARAAARRADRDRRLDARTGTIGRLLRAA